MTPKALPNARCLCGAELFPVSFKGDLDFDRRRVSRCELICANGCEISCKFSAQPAAQDAATFIWRVIQEEQRETLDRSASADALEKAAADLLSEARRLRGTK